VGILEFIPNAFAGVSIALMPLITMLIYAPMVPPRMISACDF